MGNFKLVISAAALVFAGVCSVNAEDAVETKTVTGEILDMSCYMDHGGMGEKHYKCTKSCIKSGAPAGILTKEGQVYFLISGDHGEKKNVSLFKQIGEWGGDQVTVTGKLTSKGGASALIVSKAELAK